MNDRIITTQSSSAREAWIDILKGLLLLIVCLFHTNNNWYGYLGFMFNMPAFFFISGMLFDEKKNSDILGYILKKTKSLLVPYCGLSVFFILLTPLLYAPVGYENGIKGFLYSTMLEIYQGYSGPYTLPLWFVYVLYFVSISFFSICRFTHRKIYLGLYILCCFFFAWWYSNQSSDPIFHIGTCSIAVFFYGIGYFSKGLVQRLRLLQMPLQIFYCVLLFGIYYIGYKINGHVDLRTCSLGDNIVGFLLGTVGGIGFVISAVCIYSKMFSYSLFTKALIMISKNSLTTLAVHYWVLMCLLWFYDFIRPDYYLPLAIMSEFILICIFCYIFNHWMKPLIGK